MSDSRNESLPACVPVVSEGPAIALAAYPAGVRCRALEGAYSD